MIKIEMLHFLLLIELPIMLLLSTIYFLIKSRKYKKMYEKVLGKAPQESNSVPEKEDAGLTVPPAEAEVPLSAEITAPPAEEISLDMVASPEPEPEPPQAAPAWDGGEAESDGSLLGKIGKLQRIVDFQKDKILDFMCYKDIFEGAEKKLTFIQQNNQGLQDKLKNLAASPENTEGLNEAIDIFEKNNRDLEAFIKILEKENSSLSTKFTKLEDELKNLWEEAEHTEGMDEGRYNELLKEKDDLISKLKEFEGKLQEKSSQFEDMQKQYEDIEKEYMILYKQQQEQK